MTVLHRKHTFCDGNTSIIVCVLQESNTKGMKIPSQFKGQNNG